MSERVHAHRRDSELEPVDHRREEDFAIPIWMKWTAAFINRIGFPIFAFCVLAWFAFVKQDQQTKVIGELRDVMLSVRNSLDSRSR